MSWDMSWEMTLSLLSVLGRVPPHALYLVLLCQQVSEIWGEKSFLNSSKNPLDLNGPLPQLPTLSTSNLSKSRELSLQNISTIPTSIATAQPCCLSPGRYETLHARFLLSVFAFPRVCPQLSSCHVLSHLSYSITPLPKALLWLPFHSD